MGGTRPEGAGLGGTVREIDDCVRVREKVKVRFVETMIK